MATFKENKDFWMALTNGHPAVEKQKDAMITIREVLLERDRHVRVIHNMHLALEASATAAYYFNELVLSNGVKQDWKRVFKNALQSTQGIVNNTRRYSGQECVDLIEERSSMFYDTIGMMALIPNEGIDHFHEAMAGLVLDTSKMLIIAERKAAESQSNTVNTPS